MESIENENLKGKARCQSSGESVGSPEEKGQKEYSKEDTILVAFKMAESLTEKVDLILSK